jgi:uncharacterized protein (TIGR01777 family)
MGGTGLIGSRLVKHLIDKGHGVFLLTRRAARARLRFDSTCTIVEGDPMQAGPWVGAVDECDAAVNLVGEPIFGRRWNAEYKGLLRDSRVRSTEQVARALAKAPRTTSGVSKVLVNASAIGYYGPRGDEELTETSLPGDDFLARLTLDWERAASEVNASGVRLAIIRIGVVLDKAGGALAQMLGPFRMGVGGPVGSGKQWLSWIHHADLVEIILLALENSQANGPINATAPEPVTNQLFSKALGRALHRPAVFPVPKFALRLRFGEVSEILTTGQRVIPKKALELGYRFKYPSVGAALENVLAAEALPNRPTTD